MAGAPLPQGLYFLPICVACPSLRCFALERCWWRLRPYRVGSTDFGSALLFSVFSVLLLIGVPVAFALSAASLARSCTWAAVNRGRAATGGPCQFSPRDSDSAVHIRREMMMRGGISDRLIAAGVIPGRASSRRSGPDHVFVVFVLRRCVGSANRASVSAIGGAIDSPDGDRGFDRDFAVSVTVSSAFVALFIPPSHKPDPLFRFRRRRNSIAEPVRGRHHSRLLLTVVLMITGATMARRRKYAIEAFPGFGAVCTGSSRRCPDCCSSV